MTTKMQRIATVVEIRGKCRSSHYADIKAGLFPPPIKIGPRAAAHPENETEAVQAARIAGKSDDEIRALVKQLVAQRQAA